MILLKEIIGSASDQDLSGLLHNLEHQGMVEYIQLSSADTPRRRMRAVTDKGTKCGIALPRDQKLSNGSVLMLSEHKAIVVRVKEDSWIHLIPSDTESALELGYNVGNLHWRIRFNGSELLVALEGPVENYLKRIAPLLESGRVTKYVPDEKIIP